MEKVSHSLSSSLLPLPLSLEVSLLMHAVQRKMKGYQSHAHLLAQLTHKPPSF